MPGADICSRGLGNKRQEAGADGMGRRIRLLVRCLPLDCRGSAQLRRNESRAGGSGVLSVLPAEGDELGRVCLARRISGAFALGCGPAGGALDGPGTHLRTFRIRLVRPRQRGGGHGHSHALGSGHRRLWPVVCVRHDECGRGDAHSTPATGASGPAAPAPAALPASCLTRNRARQLDGRGGATEYPRAAGLDRRGDRDRHPGHDATGARRILPTPAQLDDPVPRGARPVLRKRPQTARSGSAIGAGAANTALDGRGLPQPEGAFEFGAANLARWQLRPALRQDEPGSLRRVRAGGLRLDRQDLRGSRQFSARRENGGVSCARRAGRRVYLL